MGKITVVGSMNMDLVVSSDEIPKIGETLLGNELFQIPGGKGANQGVAVAKMGQKVNFLGKVGKDAFGDQLLKSMRKSGINIGHIEREEISTGIAVINVDKNGDNNIVVILGANELVDKAYLHRHREAFKEAEIILFQLEIPLDTVKEGLRMSKEMGKTTILNPAPAMELDDEIIKNIDILIPNEHELGRIAKMKVWNNESIIRASNLLLGKGIKKIIVTLGKRGVFYIDGRENVFIPAYKVKAIDTTAAGDSFIGGFLASYVEGRDIKKAIDLGQKTAALAIQKIGAQSSIPSREEVEKFKQEKYL